MRKGKKKARAGEKERKKKKWKEKQLKVVGEECLCVLPTQEHKAMRGRVPKRTRDADQ